MKTVEDRLRTIETKLWRTQFAFITLLVLVVGAAIINRSASAKSSVDDVLHLRGLVIEDQAGHPRLVLGAPTPSLATRKRREGVNGIVLLGPDGADRIVISYPGLEPQIMGRVQTRSIAVPSAGFLINDAEGNERAGMGVSDDGNRISLGMDYADRDAIGLVVSPNFTGLATFARSGERNDQITMGVQKDGTATFKLADSNGDEGVIAEVSKPTSLKIRTRNPRTHELEDISGQLSH